LASFREKLSKAFEVNKSLVCVGLDPDPALMPIPDILAFNKAIVDATKDVVCAYKPNLAFYEAMGVDGMKALRATVKYVHEKAPGILVIGDAKRGDVDNTSVHYAKALFTLWDFDAITVNPYLGGQALVPFFEYEDRGVFVLCRTSNPGAGEFQDLYMPSGVRIERLFQTVARRALVWNIKGNVGLVVGATYAEELRIIRTSCPEMPILIPGVGSQGGDLEKAVKFGIDTSGRNAIINSSRGIIYATKDKDGFQEAARNAAAKIRDAINGVLAKEGKGW